MHSKDSFDSSIITVGPDLRRMIFQDEVYVCIEARVTSLNLEAGTGPLMPLMPSSSDAASTYLPSLLYITSLFSAIRIKGYGLKGSKVVWYRLK